MLLAPPFYFKGVDDEGLFRWFAGLIEALGGAARDLILYNIPSVTAVTLSLPDARKVQGVASGVDETGAFLLRDALSGLTAYSGGEISLRLDAAR